MFPSSRRTLVLGTPTVKFPPPTPILDLSKEALAGYARRELHAIEMEQNRRRWLADPEAWAEERGGMFLWSKQKEVFRAVSQNRRTAAYGCHEWGKSFSAGGLTAWWIDCHPPGTAATITTAPTDRQVRAILWKEIRRIHSRLRLPGRTNLKEWYVPFEGVEELVALGMKPSDYDPAAFQGIHARFILVIFDEACGVPGGTVDLPHSLWIAADSLLANEDCRMLAIGNPDDSSTHFAEICKPGSGWKTIQTGAFDTPNFTGEEVPEELKAVLIGPTWVEERRQEWAPTWRWNAERTKVLPPKGHRLEDSHPFWLSKVLGLFPENKSARGLIPIQWIKDAQDRTLLPKGPNELGVDVGGGSDESTWANRRGPVVRVLGDSHDPDTMHTLGDVIHAQRTCKATLVKVDKNGIGWGMVNRAQEQKLPFRGVMVGEASSDPERFLNKRAEYYWGLRDRFEAGDIDLDPEDQQLAAELASIRYIRNSRGQIVIESKEAAKKRGIRSPNRADAVMLAFAPEEEEEEEATGGLVW
jgi:hypothetical protein